LTEQDDVITSLLRGTPRLGLPLVPAPTRTGPVSPPKQSSKTPKLKYETM